MITWDLTKKTPTSNGNDVFAKAGTIKSATDIDALRTRIDAALQVIKGELQDPNEGVDYFGIIFSDTPIQLKVQELCRVINSLDGVKSCEFKAAKTNRITNTLTFEFTIKSIYGDIEYAKEV